MITPLSYILWNPSLTIGPFRWYGLCWMVGFVVAYLLVRKQYREQHIKDELFEPLFIYCFIGILVGARLGHCLFYEPDYFLTSGKGVVEMFLPIRFLNDGGVKFVGTWWYTGTYHRTVVICPQDAAEHLASTRQYRHCHGFYGLFYPHRKSHE